MVKDSVIILLFILASASSRKVPKHLTVPESYL